MKIEHNRDDVLVLSWKVGVCDVSLSNNLDPRFYEIAVFHDQKRVKDYGRCGASADALQRAFNLARRYTAKVGK